MALDDLLNEFFGEEEEKTGATDAASPATAEEATATPETPAPSAPAAPAASAPTAVAPAPSVNETPTTAPAAVPAQPVATPTQSSATPTQSSATPTQSSALTQLQETAQAIPGSYLNNTGAQTTAQPSADASYQPATQQPAAVMPTPKKKNKALIILAIIAVVCVVVAFVGVGISSAHSSGSDRSGSSVFDNFEYDEDEDEKDTNENTEDATVSVKGSDEAAKKDDDGNYTVAGIVENAKDSCVGITVYTEQNAYNYFYNYNQQQDSNGKTASGEGSGVIMSEANGKTYIITCAHVIADGSSFTVTLDDDTEYEATLVGADTQTDIGVLSIEATGLQVAEFGDSKDIEVGEDCVAIGCPGGLQFKNSVTKGIVSALAVPIKSSIGYSNECIQVDAAINPGNSGGALFNMQGQVIGINSSKIASTDYEGMGFAVPSNTAIETANSLIANGYVAGRAKLGIRYNTLEGFNNAESILKALNDKGYENATGTMVIQEIDANSNLNGKVEQYDMIVAVNGETMTSTDVMTSVLSKSEPGDTVKLTIARINGNQLETFDVECELIEGK